jgi:hypothetical protein
MASRRHGTWHQHSEDDVDQPRRIDKCRAILLTGAATMIADARLSALLVLQCPGQARSRQSDTPG